MEGSISKYIGELLPN